MTNGAERSLSHLPPCLPGAWLFPYACLPAAGGGGEVGRRGNMSHTLSNRWTFVTWGGGGCSASHPGEWSWPAVGLQGKDPTTDVGEATSSTSIWGWTCNPGLANQMLPHLAQSSHLAVSSQQRLGWPAGVVPGQPPNPTS